MTFGTRVGVTTGTGEVATTTSVGRADADGTAITTADPDGTAITTADPVTTMASVDPVTMAEATTAEAAATAKPLPAQVTLAAHATVTFVRYVRVSVT